MKIQTLLLTLLTLMGCHVHHIETKNQDNTTNFFVGTYTDSTSQGIYSYQLIGDSMKYIGLATKCENPSFLARSTDGKFLLAVNETNHEGTGTVESYMISVDSLVFISRSPSGGAHPCFVTVNSNGDVLTANYTSGNVGLLKLDENGVLSHLLDVQDHYGNGPTKRQQSPHAHSVYFMPKCDQIISIDLGTDELLFAQLVTNHQKLLLYNPPILKMNPGDGPRHLAFHPNGQWIYVVNELSCTVTLLQKMENGSYQKGTSISTLPDGYNKPNTCAEIQISSDGHFLYASNRGHNSLAIYKINKLNGTLKLLDFQSTHGDGPRYFTLSPDKSHLLVANQYSNNIVLFKRDSTTGLLTYISQIEAPNPVCILF